MKALILSGGKGTRLYPLTYTRAKQLIPLANKPVLVRVIETIRDAGVTDIGVIVGDTAAEIKEALNSRADLGVHLTYIHQPSPDGLAHAVQIARDFLGDERFVMFLGDNAIQGGIGELIQEFAQSDWNCQIVLKPVKNPSDYGVAELRPDGSIAQLIEKPAHPPSNLALVGIYMFDHNVFTAIDHIERSPRNELEITDTIQWLVANHYRVFPYVHPGWWFDTGKPIDMLEANSHVLEELTPTISPDAEIDADSQVDSRVTVERGAKIINSVIRGPTIIGEEAVIENSYIGPFTSIYHHALVQDCEVERCIILEEAKIMALDVRLEDSLIGRKAKVTRSDRKPRSLKMNLGDNSTVWID